MALGARNGVGDPSRAERQAPAPGGFRPRGLSGVVVGECGRTKKTISTERPPSSDHFLSHRGQSVPIDPPSLGLSLQTILSGISLGSCEQILCNPDCLSRASKGVVLVASIVFSYYRGDRSNGAAQTRQAWVDSPSPSVGDFLRPQTSHRHSGTPRKTHVPPASSDIALRSLYHLNTSIQSRPYKGKYTGDGL